MGSTIPHRYAIGGWDLVGGESLDSWSYLTGCDAVGRSSPLANLDLCPRRPGPRSLTEETNRNPCDTSCLPREPVGGGKDDALASRVGPREKLGAEGKDRAP